MDHAKSIAIALGALCLAVLLVLLVTSPMWLAACARFLRRGPEVGRVSGQQPDASSVYQVA